jgi:tripeptide aminopeptidase
MLLSMTVNELDSLKRLLAVPTESRKEDEMVAYLCSVLCPLPKVRVWTDRHKNVFVIKGSDAQPLPCLAAHIDSVQPIRQITVHQDDDDYLCGHFQGRQVGLGADDKTGVHVALQLLHRFDNVALAFFSMEEQGHQGATLADAAFFAKIGYMIEFDAPSRHMVSYTSGGMRLFDNKGEFIQRAWPVLEKHGSTLWQRHPYSDVLGVRRRFPISCLNLSSGYYNWHQCNEFVKISDVDKAVEQGEALVRALDGVNYPCPQSLPDDEPLCPVGPLKVPAP